ncbi:MAG: flavoprotein [Phycisphaerales bacterium]
MADAPADQPSKRPADHRLASESGRPPAADAARFANRRILIGVCGGIAAYKVANVVSALAQAGAEVTVAMTEAATRFVAPLTFQSLAGRPVCTTPWADVEASDPQHVALARAVDAALIAPCTMDMLSKLATGRCDDAVSLIVAAIEVRRRPVLLAPAMNEAMWNQSSTQRNVRTLEQDGFRVIAPGVGWQACRTVGAGRMPEPAELVEALAAVLGG